jgi:hypothetical protein
MDAFSEDSDQTILNLRIALVYNNMLYLAPRESAGDEEGKVDLPLDDFLVINESMEQRIHRMMRKFPQMPSTGIDYVGRITHVVKGEYNRYVLLFLINMEDENIVSSNNLREKGKLWTLQQIEQNLDKNFFSSYFETDYPLLKNAILFGIPDDDEEEENEAAAEEERK